MPVTQKEIAERLGIDVSSCNKILHKAPGAVFRKSTIDSVMKTAKAMGFDFNLYSKGWAMALLREVFPKELSVEQTMTWRRLPRKTVLGARKVLYGKEGS